MKNKNDKLNKLSVRLIKGYFKDLNNCDTFLKNGFNKNTEIVFDANMKGFLVKDLPKTPQWVEYLDLKNYNIQNKTNSFLLLALTNNRIFAYSFGYGYSLINSNYIENDFGIKTILNCIDPTKIKSIATYSLANNSKQKIESLTKLSSIYNFDYDNIIEMVQKLQGKIKDEYYGYFESLNGSDALSITTRNKLDKLIEVSTNLLNRFESDDYLHIDRLKDINKIKNLKDKKLKITEKTVDEGFNCRPKLCVSFY